MRRQEHVQAAIAELRNYTGVSYELSKTAGNRTRLTLSYGGRTEMVIMSAVPGKDLKEVRNNVVRDVRAAIRRLAYEKP